MKSLYFWLLLILIAVQPSCEKEQIVEEEPAPVSVRFSSSISQNLENGRTLAENPSHLVISLKKFNEQTTVSEKLTLYEINGRFISEPIDLIAGDWKITDFMLTDEDNEVLYVVPKFGSTLQDAVSKPLPMHIYVAKDVVNEINVEVLRVGDHEAYDLGYASFNNIIVNPLRLAIFTEDNPTLLTNAEATIWQYGEIIKSFDLESKINLISFSGDKRSNFILRVEKDGYHPYEINFNYNRLVSTLDDLLLEITLYYEPFTFLVYFEPWDYSGHSLQLVLSGDSGSVNINFGDGTSQVFDLSDYPTIWHEYYVDGYHYLTITGDIDMISVFEATLEETDVINDIDFSPLVGLKKVQFYDAKLDPPVIDLSHNTLLEDVRVIGTTQPEALILPNENYINYVNILGSNLLNTTNIDDVISKVYSNAILHNETDGHFNFAVEYNSDEMIGPPSAPAQAKLSELKNTYGWNIIPDVE